MLANIVIDFFNHGGPIMWPILIVAIIAVGVVLERIVWWTVLRKRRDPVLLEKILTKVEEGDIPTAASMGKDSKDPVIRMLWHGLNHHHVSLQGALQVGAGIELERAGNLLSVLDTLITLAPLLGLLGTVTGIMGAFHTLGNDELAAQKVGAGISEALIATACGLCIAIFSLVPFNYFNRRVSRLRFELESNATNLELMLEKQRKQGVPAA
ncbi:MAG: MotA/TolQ/ExbB proton channel family protein [Chthoniobacteraceae bacterium]